MSRPWILTGSGAGKKRDVDVRNGREMVAEMNAKRKERIMKVVVAKSTTLSTKRLRVTGYGMVSQQ